MIRYSGETAKWWNLCQCRLACGASLLSAIWVVNWCAVCNKLLSRTSRGPQEAMQMFAGQEVLWDYNAGDLHPSAITGTAPPEAAQSTALAHLSQGQLQPIPAPFSKHGHTV